MEAKLEVVGREVIKPASPAPHDRLQLSFFDVSCPAVYVSTIFFYQSVAGGESPEIISGKLKSSLSETLSRFYPLAGRIEGFSISCNDEGAVFTEARTDLLLSDFLRNNLDDTNNLGEFLPTIAPGESAGTWPLLTVKVSFFGSGSGVAVTVAISHQICDAASLLTFIQSWATANGESNDMVMTTPHFSGATIYPPPHNSFQATSMDELFELRDKCVTNRFVFKSAKIADLKRKAASESVPVPTRVEAITSLIWRCATKASRSKSVAAKSTLMTQAMDLRLRIPPNVLSRDAIGNLQSAFFLKEGAESEMEIGKIVAEFRKAKEGVNEMIEENLQGYNTAGAITDTTLGQNLLSVMGNFISELKPDIDLYTMSSWCKKPFYKVDFGWGTPVWVGSASHTIYDNMVYAMLMDSKDGEDVEAWVGLPKQDMLMFIRDQDLLTYAVLNPPVLI
ncbi:Transferase [Arabidopsis suecica]|uniref:Transferase n=1 Tax=Arabidopsis suecica TaxID=45249 RepID=A0A8T1YMW6_ARASU|nr:Transferase [Arabidopsis suecica]